MRQRRWLTGLVVLLTVATAGCGSGEEVALDGDPVDLLRRAVERTEGTVRLRVHATTDAQLFVATEAAEGVAAPGGDSRVTVTRTFEFPEGQDTSALAARLDALPATTEVVFAGDVTYRTLHDIGPGTPDRSLPEGVQWVADRGGPAVSVADLQGYLASRGVLDLLDQAATVGDAGPTEIDGVQVRWLKATAPETGALADAVGPGTIVDVAVDAEARIRRVAFVTTGDEGLRTRVIVDIHEHGVDETVEPPPADATIDRSELEASDRPTP